MSFAYSLVVMIQKTAGQKDPIIQLLRELVNHDGRQKQNRFFVETKELVRRAFEYGGEVESLIISERFLEDCGELIDQAQLAARPVYSATEGLLNKILEAKPTPECLAIVRRRTTSPSDVFAVQNPLVMMVESGDNADNLGMLLRSTDAAGVDGVILTADTTDPFSRRVIRGSRGAIFTVPICPVHSSVKAITDAKNAGLRVVATSANANVSYADVDMSKPTMIIVGSEHVGISEDVRTNADMVVRIPMNGKINSLNIAVAASIMLYEATRQRAR